MTAIHDHRQVGTLRRGIVRLVTVVVLVAGIFLSLNELVKYGERLECHDLAETGLERGLIWESTAGRCNELGIPLPVSPGK